MGAKLTGSGDGRRRHRCGRVAAAALVAAVALACPRGADGADLAVPSGTYSLNGQTQTFGTVANSGGALEVGTGTLNAGTLDVSGGSTTVLGGRINVGTGGLHFSGAFTLDHRISLQDGVNPGVIVLGGDVTSSVTGPGGIGQDELPALVTGGVIDLGGVDRTFNVDTGAMLGAHSTFANGGLVKSGGGVLFLGAIQYTGVTRVTGGVLQLSPQASGSPNGVLILDGGDVAAAGPLAGWDVTILNGHIFRLGTGAFFNDPVTAATFRFAGGETGIGRDSYIFATTVFMSGGSNVCYAATTPFLPGGPVDGGLLIVDGGGLQLTGNASPTLSLEPGPYPGRLVLNGNVNFTGAAGTAAFLSTAPSAGQLRGKVDLNGYARTFTINDGSAAVDLKITAEVANGSLVKSGAGLLQLTAPNTYAGGTTINQGTVEALHTAALGTGPVTIGDGTLSVRSDATVFQTYGNNIAVTGDAHLTAGPVTAGAQVTALQRFGQLTIAAGRTLHADSGTHLLQFDGAANLPAGAAVTFDVTGHLALAGGVNGDAATTLNKTGPGHLHLQGGAAYTFAGPVNVYAGTLELNHDVGNAVGTLTVTGGGVARHSKDNQVRDDATVTLADGELDLQGFADGIRNLALAKGTVGGTPAGTGLSLLSPGAITVTGAAPSSIAANLNLDGARTVAVNDPAATLNVTGKIRDHGGAPGGGINKTGPGLLVLAGAGTYTGPTTVGGGTLRVTGSVATTSGVTVGGAGATFDAAATQAVRAMAVNDGGLAKISAAAAGGGVTVLTFGNNGSAAPLTLTGTGRLDLGAHALIVDHAPSTAAADAAEVASTRARIAAAYHGGDWLGAGGIGSSVAAADHSRAVGYALASDVPGVVGAGGTFAGQPGVDASSVVARLTLAGDATLDGRVDFNDLVPLAQNYNATVSSATESWWARGDFDYNGRVDFDDLVRLAQNYNAALPGEPIPGAAAGFEADLTAAFAAVPEPGGLAALGLAGAWGIGRRRRLRRG